MAARYRKLAKEDKFSPDKQSFQFLDGSKNRLLKPEAAKKKATKKTKLRSSPG